MTKELESKLLDYLRRCEAKKENPSDIQIKLMVGFQTEREVAASLADLSDKGRIKVHRSHRGRSITVYADVFDDSDDISARIRLREQREAAARAQTARVNAPPKPFVPAPPAQPKERVVAGTKIHAPVGMPPSIEMRHPDELKVDASYQRSVDTGPSRKLIADIASRWDWRLCVPLMVSKRDDGLYVIDGQHRLLGAKMRGDIPFLPCCISTYQSPADEARMFVAANRSRRAVNHLDDFHAAIVANDEGAIALNRIVTAAGLRVSRKTGKTSWVPGEVTFMAAIRNIVRKHGETIATRALQAVSKAFPNQILSNGSSVFTAVAQIMVGQADRLDEDRLHRALCAYDMRGWGTFLTGCKGGDDRRLAMREAIRMKFEETPAMEMAA